MKMCANCGTCMSNEAYFCPVCGSTFFQGVVAPQQYVNNSVQISTAKAGSKIAAGIGLFLSLIGMLLFLVAIPVGIIAAIGQATIAGSTADEIAMSGLSTYGVGIVLGLLTSIIGTVLGGISRNGIPSGAGGRGVVTAALIVGIIGIIFNAMLVVFSLFAAGFSYAAYQASASMTMQSMLFM